MRREILMPHVTPSMIDGKISRWHVAEGQAVAAGDVLAEIATSTATIEIEADNEGHVERILVPAGTEGVKVNTPIAILFGTAEAVHSTPAGASQILSFAGLEPPDPPRTPSPRPAARARGGQHPGQDISYREALRDGLAEEMRQDASVFLIGVEVAQNRGAHKVAQGLIDEFGPSRVVQVSPLEDGLFGLALGAALAGLRPVVELSGWGRAMDTLAPYLATAAETFYLSGGTLPVPIVFRGPNGFALGQTGQDARCVASMLAQIPGLKVVQPATAASAKALLKAAIRDPGPVAVLEHDLLYPVREAMTAESEAAALPGRARLARSGADVTIAAAGRAVALGLEAAKLLSERGIEADVIDLMWVRPLDREAVAASVARTGRLVTIEEGWGDGGIGAELVASLAGRSFKHFRSAPLRISGASVPMPYAANLQALALPNAEQISRAVRDLVEAG